MGLVITPSSSEGEETPLALYESERLGEAVSEDGTVFSIVRGLSEPLAEDLKRHSLDESDTELMQGTSDRRRFGEGSYDAWFAKGRYPYALAHGNALAALIWFGAEELPEEFATYGGNAGTNDTLAFRSYEPYRGKRLMGDFSRFVIDAYAKNHAGRTLWLQTNTDNAPAIRLYERLGFVQKGTREDNGRLVMVQE